MAEFDIRSDAVDVEQIMRQIRARIREKRGIDYTEQQIHELASVKLERFLDPKGVRSDLVEQFRRTRAPIPQVPNYGFEDTTLFESHRGIVRLIRTLLRPLLKLLFNPNPLIHVLHLQSQINSSYAEQFKAREELDALYYEVIHNLVLELARLGIESKNLKMRLESISSRLDFGERRERALEGVVQYRRGTPAAQDQAVTAGAVPSTRPPPQPEGAAPGGQVPGMGPRRRRRRRGRRGGRGGGGPHPGGGGIQGSESTAQPGLASGETAAPAASEGEPGNGSDTSGL